MFGAIIGDIVGSVYEHHNIKITEFPLFNERSFFTDDTVMTIAVAAGLCQAIGNPEASREAIIDSMHDFGVRYPGRGYGGRFLKWLKEQSRIPYGSFGNGSAMRVSSVAWLYDTVEDVQKYAEITASVTHNHPEGIKGAQAVATAIYLARNNAEKDDICAYIEKIYGYNLSRTLAEIRPNYTFDVTCQGSVPEAIIAFRESENFEDAIRKAISIGGDSDTIAAITGSIAEAFYKEIPPDIKSEAYERLDVYLQNTCQEIINNYFIKK